MTEGTLPAFQAHIERTLAVPDSFEKLYATVRALRDIGYSQVQIYLLLEPAILRHLDDADESLHECLCSVADNVWCPRGGHGPLELFSRALTDAEIVEARPNNIEIRSEEMEKILDVVGR
jgi:hypothetical protein